MWVLGVGVECECVGVGVGVGVWEGIVCCGCRGGDCV